MNTPNICSTKHDFFLLKSDTPDNPKVEGLGPPADFPFPFPAYDIQKDFMRNLFQSLEGEKLGIFESPTGTVGNLRTWLLRDVMTFVDVIVSVYNVIIFIIIIISVIINIIVKTNMNIIIVLVIIISIRTCLLAHNPHPLFSHVSRIIDKNR